MPLLRNFEKILRSIFGHLKISFEIQPSLPQGQSKIASNGQNQQPKIITQQPRASDSQVFFCCTSTEKFVKLREDQFDFCPQNWFQDLGNSPTTCKKFKRFLWRLSFLFTCLPLCYPCYLSRTVRRRPKHLPKQRQKQNSILMTCIMPNFNHSQLSRKEFHMSDFCNSQHCHR